MNDVSESRNVEAGNRKSILSTRNLLRIGCWNVRTMYETGKQAQVLKEMKNYKLHILGISECRWTGFGKNVTSSGETIIHSGRKDDKHQEGVALVLSRKAANAVKEYHPVNERIIRVRLSTQPVKTSIIQCYSPTNEADEQAKEEFYDILQAELEKIPKHDLVIVMGDLNAKVGHNNQGLERVMGKHGCGIMNENGEHLVDFCGLNNLVIGGTLYPHKDIHKLTWVSPGGRSQNQIDHIMINGKWRRSFQDVRVRRGADVGSDHHLVTANVKLKLMKQATPYRIRRFDTGKLRDPKKKHEFRLELKNRFRILEDLEESDELGSVEDNWQKVQKTYRETSEKILGYRRQVHKEWITPGTWKLIDKRRGLKKRVCQTQSERLKGRLREQYSDCNKQVKQALRKDKKDYTERLA